MEKREIKTSHLLFDQSPILIRPELAVRIGLNEAIVLQQVHYWIDGKRNSTKEKDYAQERTYIDGRFWTYDSYPEWQKQFPWWSVKTVERTFVKLEEKGILISGTFNEMKADRTKWYTIDYEALDKYENPKAKKKDKVSDDENGTKVTSDESKVTNEGNDAENVDVEHNDNLSESVVEQSDNLSSPSGQVVVTNPTDCREQSDNLSSPLPKSSSKISPEISDEDFITSSSSVDKEDNEELSTDTDNEDEEGTISISKLNCIKREVEGFNIFMSESEIKEVMKKLYEMNIVDRVTKGDLLEAYSSFNKEMNNKGITYPIAYFTNGVQKAFNKRMRKLQMGIEDNRVEQTTQATGAIPFFNWLED